MNTAARLTIAKSPSGSNLMPHCLIIAGPNGVIPEADTRRRFVRSWHDFQKHYKLLADGVRIMDVSGLAPMPMPN